MGQIALGSAWEPADANLDHRFFPLVGQTLVPRLRREGHKVVGIDPIPSENTNVAGSIVDRQLVSAAIRDF